MVVATVLFLVGGVWGTLSLTQEYQPEWLLPAQSEVAQWFEMKNSLFPHAGEPGFIMIKQINMAEEFAQYDRLLARLTAPQQSWNINQVMSWHLPFR